jgi:HlyD family secretion protein
MKKALRIILIVVLISGVVGFFAYLALKERSKPVLYNTESPFVTNIIQKTVATGSIVPRKEILIKPQQVSGLIDELFVEPGDKVVQGDLIAKIRVVPDISQLNAAENRFKRAKIAFEDSEIIYKRQKQLRDNGVIAELDFQQFDVNYKNAKAEMEAAENNLEIVKEGVIKKAGKRTHLFDQLFRVWCSMYQWKLGIL